MCFYHVCKLILLVIAGFIYVVFYGVYLLIVLVVVAIATVVEVAREVRR